MTKIDPTTGLAKVPDDFRWRVESDDYIPTVSLVLEIQYNYTTTTTIPVTVDRTLTFWQRVLGRKPDTITQLVEQEGEVSDWDIQGRFTFSEELPEDEVEDPSGWVRVSTGWGEFNYARPLEVTAESLQKKSVELWQKYINDKHEVALRIDKRESLKKFVGVYPPKNLAEV